MHVILAERAERLVRQRSIVAMVLGSLLAATQTWRMDDGGGGPANWIVTGLAMAAFLVWGSGVFRPKGLRGILNDEGSALNRRRALSIAFWNMLATGVVCYVLTYAKDYGPRDAIQVIMTVGISSALIAFGAAERIVPRSCQDRA